MNDQAKQDVVVQETDVWWGGYHAMTMLPSLIVCIVLTGTIVWGAWTLVERRHVQWTIWLLSAVVWFVQCWRWSWRFFGISYRLTTRRLLIDRGHVWARRRAIELTTVRQVRVKREGWRIFGDIGEVIVHCDDGEVIVLEGISAPDQVAKLIRAKSPETAVPGLSQHVAP